MKKYKKIGTQLGGSYLSNAVVFITSFFLITLLARNLSVKEFGVYSILAATITVSSVVLDLGITQYIIAKLPQKRKTSDAFFSILLFESAFVMFVIAFIALTPVRNYLISFLKLENFRTEFYTALLVVFFGTLWRFFSNYYQARKNIGYANFILILQQCLWVFFLLVFYSATLKISLNSVFLMWLFGSAATLLVALFGIRKEFFLFLKMKKFDKKSVKKSLTFGLPLLLFYIGAWTLEVGNRYVINFFLGAEKVALFALLYSLLGVILAISTTVSATFYPYISEVWRNKQRFVILLNTAVKYSLIFIIPSLAGFFILQKQIITMVSGEKYISALQILPWMIFIPLISAAVYIMYLVMLLKNQTRKVGLAYLFTAFFSVASSILLIQKLGLIGVAISMLASYAILFLILYFNVKEEIILDWKFVKLERIIFASVLMALLIYFINPQTALSKILSIIAGAVAYLCFLFILKVFGKTEILLIRNLIMRK
ncbi:MAG TPA: oligosaccharide flippase family protein [Candidatus Nanoarchaeia archaeon]|nr:oligosaccharide flippase family protein [Candidatus Nanoarchaeia archaeon]